MTKFVACWQGQLEADITEESSKEKVVEESGDALRLSLDELDQVDYSEDPLKTNRALAALLESERQQDATPIGVEEVGGYCIIEIRLCFLQMKE